MIGIITSPIVFLVLLILLSFLLELVIINLTARFMEFKDHTWKTSAVLAMIMISVSVLYSLLITVLNLFSIITQLAGVVLFVFVLYRLILKYHPKETKKQRIGFCFFVALFSFLMNFLLILLISLINSWLGII